LPKRIDLTGQKFGRLTVIKYVGSAKGGALWECKCECGGMKKVESYSLRSGNTQSCGCLHREYLQKRTSLDTDFTGKQIGKLTVVELAGIKNGVHFWTCKCECGNDIELRGVNLAKGLTKSCGCSNPVGKRTHGLASTPIYNVWNTMKSRCQNEGHINYENYGGRGITFCHKWRTFEGFHEDMGSEYKEGLTLERIDPNGNYEPSNCKWATTVEQGNNKTNNHVLTIFGEELTLSEASQKYNIPYDTLKRRIYKGWTHEEAVTKPLYIKGVKRKNDAPFYKGGRYSK